MSDKKQFITVSIHTPTQGVTSYMDLFLARTKVSIHTPTQGVTLGEDFYRYGIGVSIHTPTQGVTITRWWTSTTVCFNPHTHAGCDRRKPPNRMWLRVSIHTPTQGVTQLRLADEAAEDVSIHTPTQGVTSSAIWTRWRKRFQSTHPRRV